MKSNRATMLVAAAILALAIAFPNVSIVTADNSVKAVPCSISPGGTIDLMLTIDPPVGGLVTSWAVEEPMAMNVRGQ